MDAAEFPRIASDPAVLGGKPHLRGTRISVALVLEWIASGATFDAIVAAYPHLDADTLAEAVRYAARALTDDVVLTAPLAA